MKITAVIRIVLITVTTYGSAIQASIAYISCKNLADNIQYLSGKSNPRWYLINVLPRYVAVECTIPDSINIPVHILDKKLKNSATWPRDRKIIIHCAGGKCPLSKYAYEIVKKLGFDDVQVLEGGIASWKKDKYPVTGECKSSYLCS